MVLPVETLAEETIANLRQTAKIKVMDLVLISYEILQEIVLAKDLTAARNVFRHLIITHSRITSPFQDGGPTPLTMFFGREQELRDITEGISTTSFIIVGNRRIGKTSILHRLRESTLLKANFYLLFKDCSGSSYQSFLSTSLPPEIWQPAPPPNAPTTFEELLQRPPSDKPCVLLLDEIDKFVDPDKANDWTLFLRLRALTNEGRLRLVLSGERTLLEIMRDGHSPFYNLAKRLLVSYLEKTAVEQLVTRPLKLWEIEFQNEAEIIERIWKLTAGHPNVVQRLCTRLVNQLNQRSQRQLTLTDVNDIINLSEFQEFDFFDTYVPEKTPLLEKIILGLMAMDKTVDTQRKIYENLTKRGLTVTMSDLKDALQILVDIRCLLQRTTSGYEFRVVEFPTVMANIMTLEDTLDGWLEEYKDK